MREMFSGNGHSRKVVAPGQARGYENKSYKIFRTAEDRKKRLAFPSNPIS